VSLCRFTFDDGRRCRTPRISTNANFCFHHAQKEAQFRATDRLANDLAFFFSADYLSANDLNTALSRIFVAVARGDIKPRAARTLAYLAQTMLQTLHLAQNEFVSACGNAEWRASIIKSMDANYDYRFPSPSQPQPTPPQTPSPSPASPVAAGLARPEPPRPAQPLPQTPVPPSASHPERSEGPRQDPSSPTAEIRQCPAAPTTPTPHGDSPVGAGLARPEPPSTPPAQPAPTPRPATRDPYAVHYGPEYRLIVNGKPFSKHT